MIIQSSIGKWSFVFWGTYERISYGGWGAERRSIEIPTFTDDDEHLEGYQDPAAGSG
jgi:hypothetical protein